MTVLVLDNFADADGTLLPSHVGDSGAGWSRRSDSDAAGDMIIVTSGHVFASPDGKAEHVMTSIIPATADYTVEATISLFTGSARNQFTTIAGRFSSDGQTGYSIYLDMSAGTPGLWHLTKTTAGVASDLGTWNAVYSTPVTTVAQLVMTGTTIAANIDGVTQITTTDATYTSVGRASIGGFGVNGPDNEPLIIQFRLIGTSVSTAPVTYRTSSIRRR